MESLSGLLLAISVVYSEGYILIRGAIRLVFAKGTRDGTNFVSKSQSLVAVLIFTCHRFVT